MFKKLILLVTLSVINLSAENIGSITINEKIIATGEETGNYYKVGLELNKKMFKGKAKVIKTSGSVENMLLIAEKKADVAIVQSDALSMLDIFYKQYNKKADDLVEVLSEAYEETLHIIVNKNSKINSLQDLNDKVMVCGGKKSGSSVTAAYVEQSYNIDFKRILDVSIKKGLDLLEEGKIDVVFYVTRAPSSLLSKYQNLRLLEVTKPMKNNPNIHTVTLPKTTYIFLKKDLKTYGIKSFIIGKKDSNNLNELTNIAKKTDLKSSYLYMIPLDSDTLITYNRRYGNKATFRLDFLNNNLEKIASQKILNKLIKVNDLVNKIHFLSDKTHWKKNNYWSTPIEFIGTGCGDSEEFALLKYLFLVKLGISPKQLKLISLNKPLKISKDETIKEHIALAYFHKIDQAPVILESKYGRNKIYKYKNQFQYTILKNPENKNWDRIFKNNIVEQDIDNILSFI